MEDGCCSPERGPGSPGRGQEGSRGRPGINSYDGGRRPSIYPVPSNIPPGIAKKPPVSPIPPGVKGRTDPNAWADEDVSVELPELRTASSKTYANPDGSRTAAVFPQPVHAKTKAGWVDVDPTVRKKGTSLVADGGAFAATFSPATGQSQMVVLDLADGLGTISYSMVGAGNAKPVERQDSVVWSEVRPGVDFQVRQSAGTLKSGVVVKQPSSGSSFDFDLRLPTGWRTVANKDGSVGLVDPAGATSLTIPTPVAVDATGRSGPMTVGCCG